MNKLISTILLLFPLWVMSQPTFQMGTDTSTDECEGRLFDSGGEFGNYGADELFEFTICPSDPHDCIFLDIENWDLESFIDELIIYEGTGANKSGLTSVTGAGTSRQITAQPGCVTIEFFSDFSIQNEGFSLTWKCQSAPCNFPVFSTCNEPDVINDLPFDESQLTTCLAGNTLTNDPCNRQYLFGEEYVFAYDSPGQECVSVLVTNAAEFAGVGVYADCPNQATECLGYGQALDFSADPNARIPLVHFERPGRYYIVVAMPNGCTGFDIQIERQDCSEIRPSAIDCTSGISVNSCEFLGSSDLLIDYTPADPDFIANGVNDGCWGAIFDANFVWFYFEAQSAGQFAFTLSGNDPILQSDFDFNVWGPIPSPGDICDFTTNNQPIRSTFADINFGYEETGLSSTNPFSGINILDTCEDELGDGFVQPITVQQGEIYAILINNFDELISVTSLHLDLSETDPQVLVPPEDLPTVQIQPEEITPCEGDLVQLKALSNLDGGTFLWSTGEQTESIEFTATDDQLISVIYESDTDCGAASDSIVVEVGMPFSIDSIQILPAELDTLEVGCDIEAIAVVSPDDVLIVAWEWLINGAPISNQETLQYRIEEEGIINIEVLISTTDCEDSFSLSENVFAAREVQIPNIFSPNGDGRNDFFRPLISAKAVIIDMKVFNRWGQKVYDNGTNAQGWDGQFNSNDLPTDVYVYQVIIEQPNGERVEQQGDVTLIR